MGRLGLVLSGWKAVGEVPNVRRAVFIASPHTSNWDLPIALAICWALDMRASFVVKNSAVRFPFATFMRWLGAIPVDRSKSGNQVQKIADAVLREERVFLIIAPSGTRSKRDYWKSGFYRIAEAAKVPILLGFLDYSKREGGLGPTVSTGPDVKNDMEKIRAFYADKLAKRPEQTTIPRLREEDDPASATQS